ncbi:hypothetical protein BH23GEM5_BH23GEM5_18000 [soil metagenome]
MAALLVQQYLCFPGGWLRTGRRQPPNNSFKPNPLLVASAKARTLKSGLIQIVAKILERLSREGVLDRDDAWEYLANAREAWRSPDEEAEGRVAGRRRGIRRRRR